MNDPLPVTPIEISKPILTHILERLEDGEATFKRIETKIDHISVTLRGDLDHGGKPVVGLLERVRMIEDRIRTRDRVGVALLVTLMGLVVKAFWQMLVK